MFHLIQQRATYFVSPLLDAKQVADSVFLNLSRRPLLSVGTLRMEKKKMNPNSKAVGQADKH